MSGTTIPGNNWWESVNTDEASGVTTVTAHRMASTAPMAGFATTTTEGAALLDGAEGGAAIATALALAPEIALVAALVVVGAGAIYLGNKMADQILSSHNQTTEECAECEEAATERANNPEDPCKYLRLGNGKEDYRGGRHGETKKPENRDEKFHNGKKNNTKSNEQNENTTSTKKIESHHMPANAANKSGGGPTREIGAAIQMDKKDHLETKSRGSGLEAEKYRTKQAKLIKDGKYEEAFEMDVEDIKQLGLYDKYKEAIQEARKYARCLQRHWKLYTGKGAD